ncbi:MAG: hypothetical protein QOI66_3379 [Myxococcales bacterium]|jgi:hypothetical protein|nr:hypothetical protein [Myxococcales bacterium]
MKLVNASQEQSPVGERALPGRVNYFRGNSPHTWRTNIETFGAVRYPAVYRGIDLLYYGNRGSLEYDFIVAAGADPSPIRLRFQGGGRPYLDRRGDLLIEVGGKPVRFEKPIVYQDGPASREAVEGRFVIASNGDVGFKLGRYDHTRAVVIDPVLVYASYLGGTSQETTIYGMAVNASGQMFVTGQTNALDFPTTTGALQPKCPQPANGSTKCGPSSQSAAFVSKISADGGSTVYSTYLGGDGATNGGEGTDVGIAIAVDAQDNAYVTGYTISNNFPVTADALQPLCSPAAASFNFNTGVYEGKRASCVNAGQQAVYGDPDVFIVKLNPTGSAILYGTFLGGTANDNPSAIALDAAGNIYVGGSTSSAPSGPFTVSGAYPFPVTGSAFQAAGLPGVFVAFLAVLSADGHSLLYSSVIGGGNLGACGNGTCSNTATALAVAPATGIAYLAGFSSSATFPTTAGAFQASCPTDANGICVDNAFIAAFDPTKTGAASLVYSTRLGGTMPGRPVTLVNGIAVDATGSAYVTGTTAANDFPTTAGVLQPACSHVNANACNDAFVAKINTTGSALSWSTLYGSKSGCCAAAGTAITLDANQNVFVAGTNGGAYDLVQKDPFQATEKGNQDVFLLELNPTGSDVLFGSYFGGSANDLPVGIAINGGTDLYFAGTTTSADLPLSANAFDQAMSGGFPTGFVAHASLTGGGSTDGGIDANDGGNGGESDASDDAGAVTSPDGAIKDAAGSDASVDGGGRQSSSGGCSCDLSASGKTSTSVLLLLLSLTVAALALARRHTSRRRRPE